MESAAIPSSLFIQSPVLKGSYIYSPSTIHPGVTQPANESDRKWSELPLKSGVIHSSVSRRPFHITQFATSIPRYLNPQLFQPLLPFLSSISTYLSLDEHSLWLLMDTIHHVTSFIHRLRWVSPSLSNATFYHLSTLPSTTHPYSMMSLSHITFWDFTSYIKKHTCHRTLWCTFSRFSASTCHCGSRQHTVSVILAGYQSTVFSGWVGCFYTLIPPIMVGTLLGSSQSMIPRVLFLGASKKS